jgi:uncharacterized protein (DUF4213/DUF364 family)
MQDTLIYLAEKYPYKSANILACIRGSKYFGIMLKNGRIGVCATLGAKLETDPLLITRIDPDREDHRIYQLAYANANINYGSPHSAGGDIFDLVDFSKSSLMAMVGYFPPLVKKFRDSGMNLKVFDLHQKYDDCDPLEEFENSVANADTLIITATTLVNKSLNNILSLTGSKSVKFLLGPSTPLLKEMQTEYGFNHLFGMVFEPYEFGVLDLIGQGEGTQKFGTFGTKVML